MGTSVKDNITIQRSENDKHIVDNYSIILKSVIDKKIFVNALLNPPAPNEKLKKAQIDFNHFKEKGIIL